MKTLKSVTCLSTPTPSSIFHGNRKVPPLTAASYTTVFGGSAAISDSLSQCIYSHSRTMFETPVVIGDRHYSMDHPAYQSCPYDHTKLVCRYSNASQALLHSALKNCRDSRSGWEAASRQDRVDVFRRLGRILTEDEPARLDQIASGVVGEGKVPEHCKKDRISDVVRVLRILIDHVHRMPVYQPSVGSKNRMHGRGLEGVVVLNTAYNSSAMTALMVAGACMLGNAVLWRPDHRSVHSDYLTYKLIRQAGLPAGVLNFTPCESMDLHATTTTYRELGAVGCCAPSQMEYLKMMNLYVRSIGKNLDRYRSIPRLLSFMGMLRVGSGACMLHYSLADDRALFENCVDQVIHSAFSYSGQTYDSCALVLVPRSMWTEFQKLLIQKIDDLSFGSASKAGVDSSALIDRNAYFLYVDQLRQSQASSIHRVLYEKEPSAKIGYFAFPTFIELMSNKALVQCIDGGLTSAQNTKNPILYGFAYEDADFWLAVATLRDSMTTGSFVNKLPYVSLYSSVKGVHGASLRMADRFMKEFKHSEGLGPSVYTNTNPTNDWSRFDSLNLTLLHNMTDLLTIHGEIPSGLEL